MESLQLLATATLFSVLIAISSSINKLVTMGPLEMSVRRFAAVGGLCVFLLAAFPTWVCPKDRSTNTRSHLLAIVSGVLFFAGSLTYITMTRRYGVVQTSISTTATSFVAITIAGVLMSESVTRVDIAAMFAMGVVTGLWRLCK